MSLKKALNNVLNGQSALGHAWPGAARAVSFPKDAGAISALAQACDTLHADIKQSVGLEDDQSMSLFLAKMAVWCAKQGWNTGPKLTHGFNTVRATLVDAITESPHMISDEKAGIAGILKKHHARAAQGIAHLRKTMITDPNAPPQPIMDVGEYRLVELLTPNHLKSESVSIGGTCCVGTNYNEALLKQRGLQEGDEGSDDCLTYAIKIRSGESRIFSLRRAGDNQSVATIEYAPKHQSIQQIEGNPREISAQSPFFPALCLMLSRFSDHNIPLNGAIVGLPDCPPNHILTTNGVFTPYKKDAPHDVLQGHIAVHEDMTQDEVHALCREPRLTIDITACSHDWLNHILPERIEGTVKSSTTDAISLNHVQYMGGFDASHATTLTLPALKDVGGDFYAHYATTLTLPALQNVGGGFDADNATTLTLPALKDVGGDFDAYHAATLSLPVLKDVGGSFCANNATALTLPALQNVGRSFYVRNATTLTLPALKDVRGDFRAGNATALSLPALKDVGGSFYVRNATTLTLPALQNVGVGFDVGKAESIIIHPAMTHRLPSHLRIGEGAPSRKPTSPHP